ncbi:MAG: hypothetical protein ABSH42_05945 [Bryobacteraceae bacterium]|jgi:uncharacterized protein (TIGR03437 family)
MFRRFALLLIAPLIAGAVVQPAPVVTAVQNAASNLVAGLPASGIAQGSIFTVYGTNMGPASPCFASTVPYSTGPLCGVSLTVTVNGTSSFPIPTFVYPTQINAILPSLTPTGSGTITVTYNSQTSATIPIQVVTAAFGEFTPSGYGFGQASVTDVNYSLNTIVHTLHPGDIGILWGTGLGPISGSDATSPTTFPNIGTPTVYVGTTAETSTATGLLYAGRSGTWPGLDQINFTVPQGVEGCYVPIAVEAGGVVGSIATIAVAPAGQNTCSDSVMGQTLVNKLASGGNANFGYIRLQSQDYIVAGSAVDAAHGSGDYAWASFSGYTPQTAYWAYYGVSSGYCSANQDYFPDDFSIANLDAGAALTLSGPLVGPLVAQEYPGSGQYYAFLANSGKFLFSRENYAMIGTGGANVSSFTAKDVSSLPGVQLTAIAGKTFPRSSDLTVQWTGGDPTLQNGQVTIAGYSVDQTETLAMYFECVAPLAAGKFTIPSWVLSTMPASGSVTEGSYTIPLGALEIGQYNNPTTFTAPGLDLGIMTDIFAQGAAVYFN